MVIKTTSLVGHVQLMAKTIFEDGSLDVKVMHWQIYKIWVTCFKVKLPVL